MNNLLQTLYRYHAWANIALFDKLDGVDPIQHGNELQTALRLMSHSYVVSRIFSGHLQGVPHGFTSDNLDEPATLNDLRAAVTSSDRWYRDYVSTLPLPMLSEAMAFTFTDGDKGYMSRGEMLMHVALHAGYHRGEVGRLLWQLSIEPPWDTFAVCLHQNEPDRRLQGSRQAVSAG